MMSRMTAKVVIGKRVIFACRAALATETTTKIGYPDQKKLRHTVEERVESKMDFVTNVDFSTFPVKLCMQMKHSPILYR